MIQAETVMAYLGLGGNVGDVRLTLQSVVHAIDRWPRTRVSACSSLYQTPPWGDPDQDDYLNAVIRIETQMQPETLHDHMLRLEREHGRDRDHETRWGPRTLDIDLLLYGDRTIDTDRLTVPHPRMTSRAFVMVPLLEIDAEISIPGHTAVRIDEPQLDLTGITLVGELDCNER